MQLPYMGDLKGPFWCLARWRHCIKIREIFLQEAQPTGLSSSTGSSGHVEA